MSLRACTVVAAQYGGLQGCGPVAALGASRTWWCACSMRALEGAPGCARSLRLWLLGLAVVGSWQRPPRLVLSSANVAGRGDALRTAAAGVCAVAQKQFVEVSVGSEAVGVTWGNVLSPFPANFKAARRPPASHDFCTLHHSIGSHTSIYPKDPGIEQSSEV